MSLHNFPMYMQFGVRAMAQNHFASVPNELLTGKALLLEVNLLFFSLPLWAFLLYLWQAQEVHIGSRLTYLNAFMDRRLSFLYC